MMGGPPGMLGGMYGDNMRGGAPYMGVPGHGYGGQHGGYQPHGT